MTPSPLALLAVAAGAAAFFTLARLADTALSPRGGAVLAAFRIGVAALAVGAYLAVVGGVTVGSDRWPGLIDGGHRMQVHRIAIPFVAAFAALYDRHRAAAGRPVAKRWQGLVAAALALASITAYYNGFRGGALRFYHRWEQYHYVMGSKYFRELGYDHLYKCAVIAQAEIGVVHYDSPDRVQDDGRLTVNFTAEAQHPDRKIRNLGGDNLLFPVAELLEHPEVCHDRFSDERWGEYKHDITYWRLALDKKPWEDAHQDHGYNPPPVWTVGGYLLGSAFPPDHTFQLPFLGRVVWPQLLAGVDWLYLLAMFAALSWAFGWRVAAVAAVVWGCQASASVTWTQGAFLRQDWIFWLVFSVCLARKRYPAAAGAAMVYSALLRVFPGLAILGWLAVVGVQLARHRRLTRPQLRMLAGGTLAFAVLVPVSLGVAGRDAYQEFYRHTLSVHDRTPLTNHMGLRVLLSQKVPFEIRALGVGVGPSSGRMKYVRDHNHPDPFMTYKRMRVERYERLKVVGWLVSAGFFYWMVRVARRLPSMWAAGCLGQVFIILLSQLTCYYYTFMILLAPLTRASRRLEVPLFGFVILTGITELAYAHFDDRSWMLTLVSLAISSFVLWAFTPREDREAVLGLLRIRREA